ncbi:hypothetical protein V9L20_00870 [Variovorax sp. CCNWLW225]|jgi:hypothetical protein|uniref:hypothetical protein n=1 Tax=Variovorax sp. CCNWLW225 TaxID=3127462 RepID=UPI003076CCE9
MPKQSTHHIARKSGRLASRLAVLGASAVLAGCAVGVGFGIPLAPGVSLSVGVGPGGPSLGLSTGWGPLGAGISVNPRGQLVGSAGVGMGAGPVGVGVGRSVVLHDPQPPLAYALPAAPAYGGGQPGDPVAP